MGTRASVGAFVSIIMCTSEATHRAIIHGKGSDNYVENKFFKKITMHNS